MQICLWFGQGSALGNTKSYRQKWAMMLKVIYIPGKLGRWEEPKKWYSEEVFNLYLMKTGRWLNRTHCFGRLRFLISLLEMPKLDQLWLLALAPSLPLAVPRKSNRVQMREMLWWGQAGFHYNLTSNKCKLRILLCSKNCGWIWLQEHEICRFVK